MIITNQQAKAIRRKKADNMLTSSEASKDIGINPITFKKVCYGGNVQSHVYEKVMQWLAKDY